MIVDMTDPKSIAAWYAVWPERHGPQLTFFRRYPEFAKAIGEAAKLVKKQEKKS